MKFYKRDTNSKEYQEEQKKRFEKLDQTVLDTRETCLITEKSNFPDFLWNPLQNEFEEDDYIIRGSCTNENVLKAYTLGRKYSNFLDYLDAIDIYNDYVDYIDEVYGSFEMMKEAYDDGHYIVYIPKKPKLTDRRQNRKLHAAGFVPSRINRDEAIDSETMSKLLAETNNNHEFEDASINEIFEYSSKINNAILESQKVEDRLNNIYTVNGSSDRSKYGADALAGIFSSKTNTSNIFKLLSGEKDDITPFREIMRKSFDERDLPPTLFNYKYETDSTVAYKNSYMRQSEVEKLKVMEKLMENGILDLNDINTSGMNSTAIRMITQDYNRKNVANMTPAELRRHKQMEARKIRDAQVRSKADSKMQDILYRNRTNSLFGDDNLDFSLNDILNKYD